MIQKTKDYSMFKLREDNKERIKQAHVDRIRKSIESRNLLDLRPIVINEKFEILDGQHRYLAAKSLGVELFYIVKKELEANDIIIMNIAKPWVLTDYLNFYCKNEKQEYLKLKEFISQNELNIKTALNITIGRAEQALDDFRSGNYTFTKEVLKEEIDTCKETIGLIRKNNGFSPYLDSARFWKALIKLIRHPDFNAERWFSNLKRMTERFVAKVNINEYLRIIQYVYNYRYPNKIRLNENSFDD